MYYINKIVGAVLNPQGIALSLALVAFAVSRLRFLEAKFRRRLAVALGVAAALWLWARSTGAVGRLLGMPLELAFPPRPVESQPTADLIVVLGGGTTSNTNRGIRAEVQIAGDRAIHGFLLWKAGKAPKLHVTVSSDAALLEELGVPTDAIESDGTARNTEEEARAIGESVCSRREDAGGEKPRVLLVTSAWHMRRAKMMFDRYAKGVEVVAAPTDYETLTHLDGPWGVGDFLPSLETLSFNSYLFKEWIAWFGYRWLRK